jgi:hypothetical protein
MNKNLMKLSGVAVATVLLAATPALAEDNGSGDDHGSVDVQEGVHLNAGLHLGPIVSALAHQLGDIRHSHHATTTDQDRDNDNESETGERNEHHASSTMHSLINQTVAFGTVSSTSGTSFTLNPVHIFGATTSGSVNVETNASTQFKGGAMSTASLSDGANVIVVGTSITTTPNTITATIVTLLTNAAHFFQHLFSH